MVLNPATQFARHTAVGKNATKAASLRFHFDFGTATFVPVEMKVITARVPCDTDRTIRPRERPVLNRIRRSLMQY